MSWPGPQARWCTGRLKTDIINQHLKKYAEDFEVVQYIGIAADEMQRVKEHRYPLVEWGMTEEDCLRYCYERGYDWGGLYEIFKRVSCWCCPLQSLPELKKLREHYPELWAKLREMDDSTWRTFKEDYSVRRLEVRFDLENLFVTYGKSPRCREFFRTLNCVFSRFFHSRDKPEELRRAQDTLGGSRFSFFFGGSTSGKPVNERTALQMTAVYSCVRILSEAVAGLPLHVYRYGENGSKVKALDHPLYRLLHDEPNPEMTSFNFRETLMGHLLLYGNAYAQIIRNGKGEVIGLYPLMPTKMTVDRDSKGQIYYLYTRGSDDSPVDDENGQVYLPPEQVLHIPGLGYDGIVGYSPIAMAKNAVGMAIACEEYGAKFFANDAAPGGVLEHPGVLKNPDKVRESWNKLFRGSANSHQIAVLEEGLKYQPIGISPEQAQFLETRKFQINEIARIFRVPPHMVGDLEKSSFSNIEQQSLEFVKYTLEPWLMRWEQSMARRLFSDSEKREYFIRFNVEGLLRGDYASRMNGYAVARQNGWMSANDIRELENLDRIPAEEGGDLYLVNGSMTKLSDAGAFAGTAATNPTETEEQTSE